MLQGLMGLTTLPKPSFDCFVFGLSVDLADVLDFYHMNRFFAVMQKRCSLQVCLRASLEAL